MNKGWSVRSLKDCATWCSGGTPSTSVAEYWNGTIPWITASSLHNFYIRDSERRVTPSGLSNGTRLVPEGSILFVVRGMSLKSEFRVGIARRPVAFGQDCKALLVKNDIDPLFLANVLRGRSSEILGLTDEASHGTGRLATEAIEQLQVLLPPIAEQKAIAHILGTLDDKIELNQQMNQTLEAMQWSIFNNWFYSASEDDNWQSLPLEECVDAIIDYRGKTPKKTQHGIPLITAKIVKRGKIAEPQEFIDPQDYDAWMRRGIPRKGDVVMTTEAPLGEIAKLDGKKVALAQRLITLRGKQDFLDNICLKFLMQSSFIQEQLQARATGSTVLGIKQSELRQVTLPVPSFAEQQQIMEPIQVMEEKIDANDEQSRSLTEIRDRLLPKLLSGELRVKDAEKIVEELL